jgi:hypothetical protein
MSVKINPIGSNMTELELANGNTVLFSYKTPVAVRSAEGAFKTDCRWSLTTKRHISKWGGSEWPTKPQEFFDRLA